MNANGGIAPIPFSDLAAWQSAVVHYAGGDFFWYDHPPGADGKFKRVLVKAGASTSLMCYSGGKSGVGGRGLIRLNVVNANSYKGSPKDASYELPWWNTTIYPITNWSGCFLAGNLQVGAGGEAWVTLPDNETKDVTFTSRFKHYSADVVPEKYKINIMLTTSTTNANLAYDVPEVCVGQKVTFALTNLPMGQIKNILGGWKLPQKYVNQENKYSATCTNYVRNDNLLFHTNAVSCWFVNGSGDPVSVSVGLNLLLTNGTFISVTAVGKIAVVMPTIVGMTNSCDGVGFSTNSDGTIDVIYCHQMTPTVYVKRPDHFSGKAFYTQLIKRSASWDVAPNGVLDWTSTWGNFWLDTEEEYGQGRYTRKFPLLNPQGQPTALVQPVGFADSPELGGKVLSHIACQDDFNLFLRFQPDGDGIPVTIGVLYWGWHGNADRVVYLTDWSFVGSYYGSSLSASEDRFPLWSNKYTGTSGN